MYTFDDGSTIDYSTGASTPAPQGMLLTDYANNFAPGNFTQGASSFMDVLKFGIGRVADYKTASLTAQNAQPQYAPSPVYGGEAGISPRTMMIGAAVLLGGLLLVGAMRR